MLEANNSYISSRDAIIDLEKMVFLLIEAYITLDDGLTSSKVEKCTPVLYNWSIEGKWHTAISQAPFEGL